MFFHTSRYICDVAEEHLHPLWHQTLPLYFKSLLFLSGKLSSQLGVSSHHT